MKIFLVFWSSPFSCVFCVISKKSKNPYHPQKFAYPYTYAGDRDFALNLKESSYLCILKI